MMRPESETGRHVGGRHSSVSDSANKEMLATKNLANAARDKENTPAYEVKLERVLGLTVSSNAALDCDPATELVAYPAGCTVVLFNPRKGRQQHLLNTSRKTITCLAFSSDGRYLATGECGHLPSVRVWEVTGADIAQVAEFPGHKYGINCVAFSPSHKYVVSVGSQHDMIVNVWDWRANVKVASNKVSTKVKAVSFAENGNYFVTVGNRHVKFWYLEYSRSAKYKDPVPLMGRSAILGEQRNNYFCDVACGRGDMGDSTYAITKSGLLCEFNNRRLLDKWVELRTTSANCMAVGETFIFIGCAEGIIRCFSPATLQFVTTLPRTHYLGVDVAQGLNIAHMATPPPNAKYPDAVALAYDHMNHKLTCVYNDHSLYVWDVHDIKRVGKSHSFLFHSACIWGVEMYPVLDPEVNDSPAMPPGCFITCSSDDTIRVWNLDPNLSLENDSVYKRNIYSNELLKVLYVDKELTYLKDLDLSGAGASEKADTSYDGRNGVRSIRISPDGKHLASGDRSGNIRIHVLKDLQELCRIEAHDAEVLCLEYSRHDSGHRLLASASRDRLIHVFSVDEEYNFLQTLDDHSSSITAVRFLNAHEQLQMVSCGADKSIIFRQLQGSPGGTQNQFSRGHNVAGKTTLYDMEVDSGQKHILTACQDRNIRVYNVSSGKHSKTFKGSVGEDGSLIKVVLDSSGIYAATSCTDKTLCIYDYYSGECMATMFGHSELVTGLRFTNDCRRLVSASGDGCIFMWKVPHDMVVTMHARLAQQAARAGRRPVQIPNGLHLDNENFGPPTPEFLDPNANSMDQTDYRFSVGQLPLWAKKQIVDNSGTSPPLSNRQMDLPKGRWAQKLDARSITVKSVYDSDSIIPLPITQVEKRTDSEGSKDSSIDSGTELRGNYSDYRQETVVISKQVSTGKMTLTRGSDGTDSARSRHLTDDSSIGSYKYEDMESTEHDGDVEDYSEGEGESTEPEQLQRLIYYPPAEETGSDYTVNAMDSEELRRSVRRHKKNHVPERLLDVVSVSASVSGSQDSDEDDEDASTPSAETADRNILSMLSVSTESLDMVGQREKYLKNTFESLSGAEMDAERTGGTSISSQFLVRASLGGTQLRNVAVINAAKQARSDTETSRKREELQRRIEETRRKLQSVGYRSNLKSSQSITDLSHYPEKDGRSARATNHAHRYTSVGGKQYATVIRHRMSITLQSELSKPLSLPPSSSQPRYIALKALDGGSALSHSSLPLTAKGLSTVQNSTEGVPLTKMELARLQSYPPSNIAIAPSKTNSPPFKYMTYTKQNKTNKNIPDVSTASQKNSSPLPYHTLPIAKKTSKLSAHTMSLVEGIPSMSRLSLPPEPKIECHSSTVDDSAWISVSSTNSAFCSSVSTVTANTTNIKALNAVRTNISTSVAQGQNEAQSRKVSSPTKRPVFLNLRSGNKYRQSRSGKPPLTNQSLPESPVCEDLNSPTALFHNLTDTESANKSSRFGQARRSCSYFIDLSSMADEEFPRKDERNVAKSSESLPAILNQTNASSEENLLDSCDDDDADAAGNFSSDSLEEPSEFSNRIPRRCVSDYQIFNHRSLGTSCLGDGSRSHENILSTNTSCNNSGDILEMCARLEQERHSSASFFLSRRCDLDTCRSQESILTDESESRFDRETCRSTESILESDYNFSAHHARHRDSFQSTESILTDDSDCQVFGSSQPSIECGFVNKGFNLGNSPAHAPVARYFRSPVHSLSEYSMTEGKQNSTLQTKEIQQDTNGESKDLKENQHRTVFRTRSLQDTRSSAMSLEPGSTLVQGKPPLCSSRPQTPCRIGSGLSNAVYRKNSYPRSRPQTPTSVQLQQPFLTAEESYNNAKVQQEAPQSPSSSVPQTRQQCSQRPPTAPKPVVKITHKPPPKPRQKPQSYQGKQRPLWTPFQDSDMSSKSALQQSCEPTKPVMEIDNSVNVSSPECTLMIRKLSEVILNSVNDDDSNKKEVRDGVEVRPSVGVKLLCKSFENVVDEYDMSDECVADLEEDSFPVAGGGSGSSTPATSSSAANSPKRMWPPASRAPVQRPLAKRLATRQPVLPDSDDGADMESGNLRRSCSLSDLANPAPRRLLHASHVQVSGKVSNKGAHVTRTLPRHSSKQSLSVNSNMTRSTSMGMLNQSDSESDLSFQRSNNTAASRMNGLMRPTISSQNKVNNLNSAKNTSNGPQPRRRGLQSAYSSVNLSQVGNNEDSSSEETSPVGGKPGGSTRPRSTSIDRASGCAPNSLPLNANQAQTQLRRGSSSLHSRYGSDRDLSRGAREVTQRLTSSRGSVVNSNKPVPAARHSQLDASPQELSAKDTDMLPSVDIASAPLSQQLCSTLGEQLTRTADSVVQLYKRLALEGDGQIDRETMLRGLEEAASEAQRTLRRVGASTNTSAVSVPLGASALAQDPQLASKLESLVSSGQAGGTGDQGNMVVMMQQYTDMLLTLVQQRMSTPGQQKPS